MRDFPINPVLDYLTEVARGNVQGASFINKFGKNPDVDIGTSPEDVWDGPTALWVAPTIARTHQIKSTSVEDDPDKPGAGTGAWTVEIQGLDADWNPQTETVALNGTADVATADTYRRIFRMKVLTAGSGGVNAGIITATADTDATVTATIAVGNNQTMMAIYTVAVGKKGLMQSLFTSVNAASPASTTVEFELWARDAGAGGAWQLNHSFSLSNIATSSFQHVFGPPKTFEEKHDIRLTVLSTDKDNTVVTGGFDILMVPV